MRTGRPRDIIPSVSLHLKLPQDLMSRLSLHLYRPSEGRIPQGSFQKLFVELITKYLKDLPPCP
jgi:hypothetical protein